MSGVLEGIRVIDFTVYQAGPVAGMLLGDLGAEVIHVEHPDQGDPERQLASFMGSPLLMLPDGREVLFEYYNRNKKSITVDVRKPEGVEIIYRLTEKSDVFICNLRRKFLERYGLDYSTLSKYNPQLIYASSSGYGLRGPQTDVLGYDSIIAAKSGLMAISGEQDGPPAAVSPGVTSQINAIVLSYGVVAALLARERLGIGQEVEVSQLGAMILLQGLVMAATFLTDKEFRRHNRVKAPNPLWNMYQCKDGRWIYLGMLGGRDWPIFCKAIGMPELISDHRFDRQIKREENCEALISILDRVFITRTSDEWLQILRQAGDFAIERVNNISDLVNDPQLLENGYIIEFDHPTLGRIKYPGHAINLHKTPLTVRSAAPELGQHTEEVLTNTLDYTQHDIQELRDKNVI